MKKVLLSVVVAFSFLTLVGTKVQAHEVPILEAPESNIIQYDSQKIIQALGNKGTRGMIYGNAHTCSKYGPWQFYQDGIGYVGTSNGLVIANRYVCVSANCYGTIYRW